MAAASFEADCEADVGNDTTIKEYDYVYINNVLQ